MSGLEKPAKRLLVIDDDESLREIFRLTMTKEGFIVADAEDGVKGLEQVGSLEPDLIVVDLMMPALNGFEVIHNLQTLGLSRIPVIVITGYSESSNEEMISREPNVVGFLKKPIKYADLALTIRSVLKLKD